MSTDGIFHRLYATLPIGTRGNGHVASLHPRPPRREMQWGTRHTVNTTPEMLLFLLFSLVGTAALATDNGLPNLSDITAAEAFINASEVAVIGFFETPLEERFGYKEFVEAVKNVKPIPVALCSDKEAWARFSIVSDTIAIFRKADNHQENLQLSEAKKIEADGLARFITMNEIRYITEYNQVTAVGLFQSEVKTHLLLFINRGSADYESLKDKLAALAQEFVGKFLFVLIHGVKSNEKSLGYFGLTLRDLPRIGIYDSNSDMKWLMPEGEISTERVREFCQSFLEGDLKDVKQAGTLDPKTEL
ncbi:endoplasmic reticulum resident protein 27 [Esox lucius]|nr:endoplasmic reticulum resident protein 27 [Esox lucius]